MKHDSSMLNILILKGSFPMLRRLCKIHSTLKMLPTCVMHCSAYHIHDYLLVPRYTGNDVNIDFVLFRVTLY